MNLEVIQTAISTLGFPIVITIALMWFVWKLWNKTQEQNDKREMRLYEVIATAQVQNDTLSKTNEKFVLVLNTYKEDLKSIKDDVADIKQQLN